MAHETGVLEIDDIEAFGALNSPHRLKIVAHLIEPKTVKQLAEEMGVPKTRLYYHVNLLEEVGLIEVVEVNKSGAMLEKVYAAVATSFRPSEKMAETGDPEHLATVSASLVLDAARVDAEAALTEHFRTVRSGGDSDLGRSALIGRSLGTLSPESATEFARKLEGLIDEFSGDEEHGVDYGFSFVFLPIAGSDPVETG